MLCMCPRGQGKSRPTSETLRRWMTMAFMTARRGCWCPMIMEEEEITALGPSTVKPQHIHQLSTLPGAPQCPSGTCHHESAIGD